MFILMTKSLLVEAVKGFEGFEDIVVEGIGEEAQPGIIYRWHDIVR